MTGDEALQEIKARKDALAKQAQGSLNTNYGVYSDYLKNVAQSENRGALNSYQNYPALQGTDSTRSRSAYLNRLASANGAYTEAMRGLDLYQNRLGANLNAASLNADADINGIEYKNALYGDQLAYQRERDKVADDQWQKNFDLGYLSSSGSSGGGRSYGGYGGYSSGYGSNSGGSGYGDSDEGFLSSIVSGINPQYPYDRYAMSLIGRGAKNGELDSDEAAYLTYLAGANGSSNPVYQDRATNIINKPNSAVNKAKNAVKSAAKKITDMTK